MSTTKSNSIFLYRNISYNLFIFYR